MTKSVSTRSSSRPTAETILAITNDISSLFRRCFGRGPARARGYANDAYLFVVLEGVLAEFEETLLNHDDVTTIRLVRTRFQEIVYDEIVSIVERHAGLRVVDYMSQVLPKADVVVEIFVLDHGGTPG